MFEAAEADYIIHQSSGKWQQALLLASASSEHHSLKAVTMDNKVIWRNVT